MPWFSAFICIGVLPVAIFCAFSESLLPVRLVSLLRCIRSLAEGPRHVRLASPRSIETHDLLPPVKKCVLGEATKKGSAEEGTGSPVRGGRSVDNQ